MNTEALSLSCSLLRAVGQGREGASDGWLCNSRCWLHSWPFGVLQLACAVSDPEMGRVVPCCSAGLRVMRVEPYEGPDGHKSQAQAALG